MPVLVLSLPILACFDRSLMEPQLTESQFTISLTSSVPAVTADGTSTATLTVEAIDISGRPVAGRTAILTCTNGPVLSVGSGMTDHDGVFAATVSSTKATTALISASVGHNVSSVSVNFVPASPSQQKTTFFVDPNEVAADGRSAASVIVTVEDLNGNRVTNQPIRLTSNGHGDTFAAAAGATDLNGIFSTTMVSTTAESKVITASIAAFTMTATANFFAVPSDGNSTISLSPTSVLADGTSSSTLTVFVGDAQGRPVSGQAVSVTANGTQNTLVPSSGNTDSTGHFAATLSSTLAQVETVTATVGSLTKSAIVTFVAGPADSNESSIVAVPSSTTADGAHPIALTVTVRDAHSNAVTGCSITFAGTGAQNTFAPPTGNTDPSGKLNASVKSTLAQSENVIATCGPASFSTPISFVAGPAVALSMAGVGGTEQQAFWLSPAVTALDAYGNIATSYGGTVTWASSDSNATLPGAYSFASTDAGVHTFTGLLRFLTMGAQNVTVSAGTGVAAQANVMVSAPTVVALPLSGGPTQAYGTCAVLSNEQIKCWGNNDYGQLGVGDTVSRGSASGQMGASLPYVSLGTGRSVSSVALGDHLTCAIMSTGSVKCWGVNNSGEQGLGDTVARGATLATMGDALPELNLGTGRTAIDVTVSHCTSACALLDNQQVKCWGNACNGALGYGDTISRGASPAQMGDGLFALDLGTGRSALAISAGSKHVCAVLDTGQVKCWGDNSTGELGVGDSNNRGDGPAEMGDNLQSVSLGTGRTALDVKAGNNFSCALLDNGQLKCWGSNTHGELGDGDTKNRGSAPGDMGDNLPYVNLGTGRSVINYAVGSYNTCAVLDNGQGKCWGWGNYGQSGNSNGQNWGASASTIGDALPAVNFASGAPAAFHISDCSLCALLTNGAVTCWGYNVVGELGLGDTTNRTSGPAALPPVVLW